MTDILSCENTTSKYTTVNIFLEKCIIFKNERRQCPQIEYNNIIPDTQMALSEQYSLDRLCP